MIKEPEFYENWEDDNHCLQASVMMVFNALLEPTDWNEINKITNYEDGLYSWSSFATLAIAKRVPGTKLMSSLDYEQFAERGVEYLKEYMHPDWFKLQERHATEGFQKEQKAAMALIKQNLYDPVSVSKENIEELLNKNMLIAVVDAGALKKENWSSGHFVLVYGQNQSDFILHDPGLPPRKTLHVNKDDFFGAFKSDLIIIPNKKF